MLVKTQNIGNTKRYLLKFLELKAIEFMNQEFNGTSKIQRIMATARLGILLRNIASCYNVKDYSVPIIGIYNSKEVKNYSSNTWHIDKSILKQDLELVSKTHKNIMENRIIIMFLEFLDL